MKKASSLKRVQKPASNLAQRSPPITKGWSGKPFEAGMPFWITKARKTQTLCPRRDCQPFSQRLPYRLSLASAHWVHWIFRASAFRLFTQTMKLPCSYYPHRLQLRYAMPGYTPKYYGLAREQMDLTIESCL